ncbi:Alpha/Beta hydrolase protein [Stachybotrys elegans]|uniref:Alpha/Beta hydrolase protein n=1 Tax=Stachybotrys elegans TaxID=80388 RepID=A0A8K0WUM6_9HYPO|nr:Alpha/Beta hydrolase protein [Stachybotrys elegans]
MSDGYATKGLPPPPEVSLKTLPMAGLLVDVYGIDELPPAAPVTCLWLLHPRTRTRGRMYDIASRTIHAWKTQSPAPSRGLVALAFDMPNHGTREVDATANKSWDQGNEQHALDLLGMVKGGRMDMSALMDLVAGYLGREVDAHVCLGWSLGGHAAWQSWFGEERIDAAVVVVGCPDQIGLMAGRFKECPLDCEGDFLGSRFFPPDLVATCERHDPKALLFGTSEPPALPLGKEEQARLRGVLEARVRGKKLLACSGGEDPLVPYGKSAAMLALLRDAAEGWFADGGVVVEDRVYEGVGHRFSKDMVVDAVAWLVKVVGEGPRERTERARM